MKKSHTNRTSQSTVVLLCLFLVTSSIEAFTYHPIDTKYSITTNRIESTLPVGNIFEIDPIFLDSSTNTIAAVAAAATAATTTTASSKVTNFLFGSLVLIGAVATLKWNTASNSDQIRDAWENLTKKPIPIDEVYVPGTMYPLETSTDESTTTTTTSESIKTVTKIPRVSNAATPVELSEMMKAVTNDLSTTETKKTRVVVKILKKVIMPWRRWKNL